VFGVPPGTHGRPPGVAFTCLTTCRYMRHRTRLSRPKELRVPASRTAGDRCRARSAAGPERGVKITVLKRANDVELCGELADPRVAARLAARAEERGWDGFFVWDHIDSRAPVRAVADPWVALAAVACATSRIRIGALVTPLSRRRVHKVA